MPSTFADCISALHLAKSRARNDIVLWELIQMLPPNIHLDRKEVTRERRDHWDELLHDYGRSGLAGSNVCSEIKEGLAGETQKFCACLWEAMLYRHFKRLGFGFRCDYQRASGQNGPDLGLTRDSRTVWIEAIVPKPEGVPDEWRNPEAGVAHSFGSDTFGAIRLRWTAAVWDKLKQLNERIVNGIVSKQDEYIVAVNSCMLHQMEGEDFGLSQLPYAIEAVLPIGPLVAHVPCPNLGAGTEDTQAEAALSWQCEIKKSNGSVVRTDSFLDENYSRISALIACSRVSMLDGNAYLIVVHNPLARNPLGLGRLGAHVEYTVENISADSFDLHRHPANLLRSA